MMMNKNWIWAFLLALLPALSLFAQESKTTSSPLQYRQAGWWTFGINGGLSYQSSDVRNTYEGWGLGLTLAKNLYYQPNAPLAFDLRGRFLYANQRGQDVERSTGLQFNQALNGLSDQRDFISDYDLNYYQNPDLTEDGYYFANYRADLVELGLEGVFNLNRLRERTGVIVNLYGGLNLDWYRTRINQANDNGFLDGDEYDYSSIPTSSRNTTRNALESVMDDSYETVADGFDNDWGTFTWMPSLGFEVGYHFTPKFYMYAGHKFTWTRDDIIDGQRWTNNNTATDNNDLYHYTQLGLRWIVEPGRDIEPPIINIIRPQPSPHETNEGRINIDAEILHVENISGVEATLNGRPHQNFVFNPSSNNFTADVLLEQSVNTYVIRATNAAGSDIEEVVIIYKVTIPEGAPIPAPAPAPSEVSVDITRPSGNYTTVTNPTYNLEAIIEGVDNRSEIKYYQNGELITNYSYSFSTNQLQSTLDLVEGNNNIRIVASNDGLTEQDQVTIIYEPEVAPCSDPMVKIDNVSRPNSQGFTDVRATVRNVNQRSQVRMYINGGRMTDFQLNTNTGRLTATPRLQPGNNRIRIVAQNECGRDEDMENITLNNGGTVPGNPTAPGTPPPPPPSQPIPPAPPQGQPPIVDISTPNNGSTTNNSTVSLRATVQHVANRNQVRMTVNGDFYNNFNFYNGNVNANNIPLQDGANVIEVQATNNYGRDSDDVIITYNAPNNNPTPPGNPCPEPTVNITEWGQQTGRGTSQSNKAIFKAKVSHVNSKSELKLYLNNKTQNYFSFNRASGQVSATLTLEEGSNTVRLVANTDCGNDDDTETIQYSTAEEVKKPVVNIVRPNNNDVTNQPNTDVRATVINVTKKSDISVQVNGSSISNFSFNAGNKTVRFNANLQEGNNSIIVKAENEAGSDTDNVNVKYEVEAPCEEPEVKGLGLSMLAATPDRPSTNLASYKAEAKYVNSKNQIKIYHNGNRVSDFTFNAATGLVRATIELERGNNTVRLVATNDCGQDEDVSNINYDGGGNAPAPPKPAPPAPAPPAPAPPAPSPAKPKPVVNVVRPNGGTVSQPKTNLQAAVMNVSKKSDITVKVNGKPFNGFSYNASSNSVRANNVPLKEGNNRIVVTATNESGTASDEGQIRYQKPATPKPPKVKITQPTNNAKQKSPRLALTANVTHIDNRSQVTVRLNGKSVSGFNLRNGKVTASLILEEGRNNIQVQVKNKDGQDQDAVSVTYTKPAVAPIVKITQPKGEKVSQKSYNIKANLRNVTSKNQIKVLVNGKNISNFKYSPRMGSLTATIQLKSGKNQVRVTATTNGGTAYDQKSVVYKTTPKPTINFKGVSMLAATPSRPANDEGVLRAEVRGVASRLKIQVIVNGKRLKSFDFNPKTNDLEATIKLKKGSNNIEIKATNEGGTTSVKEVVDF